MRDPTRVRVTGPLAPYAAGFAEDLVGRGYAAASACRLLHVVAHASRWLEAEGLDVEDLSPARIESFCQARRDEGYVGWLSPAAMAPLMTYLAACGAVVPSAPSSRAHPLDELIVHYVDDLVAERGVAPATVRSYVRVARQFLASRPRGDVADMSPGDIVGFVGAECPRLAPRRPPP